MYKSLELKLLKLAEQLLLDEMNPLLHTKNLLFFLPPYSKGMFSFIELLAKIESFCVEPYFKTEKIGLKRVNGVVVGVLELVVCGVVVSSQ